MRGSRAPERGCEFGRRGEGGVAGVYASGQSRGDLLEQPAVAVRIAERGKGTVAGVIRRGTAHAAAAAVGLELGAGRPGVEHLADADTAGDEAGARSLDVRDDQVQALRRARR